jgi:hypothetical protein
MSTNRKLVLWSVVFAVAIEGVTILCRHVYGGTGAEFAAKHNVPLVLRLHHFWWGLALVLLGLIWRRNPNVRFWLVSIGAGVFFSDVLHHLVYCPLAFGNIAWHWP